MKVTLSALEENPSKYTGQKISFSGEIQEVLGPRLFTVDEKEGIDFDGETLVLVPAPMAALVREDATVTITGIVRPFVRAEIEREWGWFESDPGVEIDFSKRAVVVADTVTSEGAELAIRMTVDRQAPAAVGTSGTAGTAGTAMPPLNDVRLLAESNDEALVGRRVHLQNARVTATVPSGGVWIAGPGEERLFVLPSEKTEVGLGQTVSITGVVLELPSGMKDKLGERNMGRDETFTSSPIRSIR